MRGRVASILSLSLLLTSVAAGQSAQPEGFTPVEQRVADTEPLRTSLRRVSTGIGQEGQESWMYRRADAAGRAVDDGRLYLLAPGVSATFDRSQYVKLVDERRRRSILLQKIPANTVFHIGTPHADRARLSRSPNIGRALMQRRRVPAVQPIYTRVITAPTPRPPQAPRVVEPPAGPAKRDVVAEAIEATKEPTAKRPASSQD